MGVSGPAAAVMSVGRRRSLGFRAGGSPAFCHLWYPIDVMEKMDGWKKQRWRGFLSRQTTYIQVDEGPLYCCTVRVVIY